MAAQLEAATGKEYSPRAIWHYAIANGCADNRGMIDGRQSQVAKHFAPDVLFIEFANVGRNAGHIKDGNLAILIHANKSRVAWFKNALRLGTIAINKSAHSIYVYDIRSSKRPWILRWLGEFKHEFLGYDPQRGLVTVPVSSMSQSTVSLAIAKSSLA